MTRFYSSFVCICSITFVPLTMSGSFSVNYAEAWVSNCFNQRLRGLHNICVECSVTFRCTNSASTMSKKFLTHWLYVPVMSWKNGTISFWDDPNVYQRIVHLLQISHLRHNNNLVANLCSLNWYYEAGHRLLVCFKTFESFKLLICRITCLKN